MGHQVPCRVCVASMVHTSFIMAQMPQLNTYLHYRMIDVSSLALVARYTLPEIETAAVAHKQHKHEVLADIRESIEELKHYRACFVDYGEPGLPST